MTISGTGRSRVRTIDGRTYYADIGLPGPDKGEGGKYLVLPPGYEGDVPDDEYFVYRSKTNGVFVFLRGFFDDPNSLEPAVANMQRIRIYPLDGEDTAYMRGLMAAIGIAKGQEFEPSERQRELLDYAAQTAWKMAKVVAFDLFEDLPKAKWYPDRQWLAHVRNGGDDLTVFVDDMYYQVDGEHYIDVDAQLHMFINAYSMSPGMMTSIPGVGAKYLEAAKDSDGHFLVGDRTYRLTLPPDVPAKLFWSVTAYDATTAAGLDNAQPFPSINSKHDVQMNEDGSVTLYFGPEPPEGKESNWVATVPGKGWFSLLRLYGPEQPFFDKSWIPGDFERLD